MLILNKLKILILFKHENFSPTTFLNDIAIIKLQSKVSLNNNVELACLPSRTTSFYPSQSYIDSYAAGWGLEAENAANVANSLNNVKLTIYPFSVCDSVTGADGNYLSQICAGELAGGKDTCQGDSGGPLFVKDNLNSTFNYVLAGVTSYGIGCAQPNKPGIYTRVSYHIPWIEQYIYN